MLKPSTTKYLSIAALAAAGAFASVVAVQPAKATVVATIQGAYDKDFYDTPELDFFNIPRSRQDPKIGGKDDAEIISDRIAKLAPFPRDFVA